MSALIRIAARPLLFLALGAAITLAVAWLSANIPAREVDRIWQSSAPTGVESRLWAAHLPAGFTSSTPTRARTFDERGVTTVELEDAHGQTCRLTSCGFPFECVWGGVWHSSAGSMITERTVVFGDDIRLPYGVRWPWLLAGAVIYGLALWFTMYSVVEIRGFARLERGVCPRCRYPLSHSMRCTECGEARVRPAIPGSSIRPIRIIHRGEDH